MRDPKRIDKILKEVKELWKANPDWRFCQLAFIIAKRTGTMNTMDIFHVEDDIFEKALIIRNNEKTIDTAGVEVSMACKVVKV